MLGWRSIVLLIAIVHGLVVIALLVTRRRNRAANVALAALLFCVMLAMVPSLIGFAGAYQRFPDLQFAPFDASLALGPLAWLYLRRLLTGGLPRAWAAHFVPAVIQLGYWTTLFILPREVQMAVSDAAWHQAILIMEEFGALLSVIIYWCASFRLVRQYEHWTADARSDADAHGLRWVRFFLWGIAAGVGLWAGFDLTSRFITPLGYDTFFWFDLFLAALVYTFAMAGFRYADHDWPTLPADATPGGAPPPAPTEAPDWTTLATAVDMQMRAHAWHRDPDLTLARLASKLATNTWTLSRAINEGAGCNFNDFVNGFRVDEVKAALADPDESRPIMVIATDAGFAAKTSFNRAFRKLVGETPSTFRARARISPSEGSDPE